MGVTAKEYYINDLSSELIELYRNIATDNEDFFQYVEAIDKSWNNSMKFFLPIPSWLTYILTFEEI